MMRRTMLAFLILGLTPAPAAAHEATSSPVSGGALGRRGARLRRGERNVEVLPLSHRNGPNPRMLPLPLRIDKSQFCATIPPEERQALRPLTFREHG